VRKSLSGYPASARKSVVTWCEHRDQKSGYFPPFAPAISRLGASLKPKPFGNLEDQLRGPLENLIADLAHLLSFQSGMTGCVDQTILSDLWPRPGCSIKG